MSFLSNLFTRLSDPKEAAATIVGVGLGTYTAANVADKAFDLLKAASVENGSPEAMVGVGLAVGLAALAGRAFGKIGYEGTKVVLSEPEEEPAEPRRQPAPRTTHQRFG